MAPRFAGRLVLSGLMSCLGFGLFAFAGPAGQWLGTPMAGIIALRMAGGIAGWLGLAWICVVMVELVMRRAIAPPRLVQDIARALLFTGAALAILAYVFDQPIGGVLATSGVLVAVVGFALRGVIADVFSGIAINLEHPYRIGDWVQLDSNAVGMVVEINWRATRLLTRDSIVLVVPNGIMAGSRLTNFSFPQRHYRAALKLALPASVPVEKARRLLMAAVLGAEKVLAEPRPEVQAEGFDERGMVYVVRYWVGDYADDNPCRDAVAAGLAGALQRAGLVPGSPRREIAIHRRSDGAVAGDMRSELRRVPLFAQFSEAEIDALAERAEERRFKEGEMLCVQDEPGSSLHILAEGVVEVRVKTPSGEAAMDRLVAGQVFGEISLLTGQKRIASVAALTDGLVFEIRKEHLEPVLRARPQLAEGLAALMAERQRHNRDRLAAYQVQAMGPTESGDLLMRLRAFFRL